MNDAHMNQMIAKNIRLHRIRLGLTHRELAARIATRLDKPLKHPLLRHYEKGRSAIPASQLHAIAAAIDTPIHFFFEPCRYEALMTARNLRIIESFSTIKTPGLQAAVVYLLRHLSSK